MQITPFKFSFPIPTAELMLLLLFRPIYYIIYFFFQRTVFSNYLFSLNIFRYLAAYCIKLCEMIWWISHPSLLRTFGFSVTSTYDSYLPLIFGKFALIWCCFQNIFAHRFLVHWVQRRLHSQAAGFWGWKKSK